MPQRSTRCCRSVMGFGNCVILSPLVLLPKADMWYNGMPLTLYPPVSPGLVWTSIFATLYRVTARKGNLGRSWTFPSFPPICLDPHVYLLNLILLSLCTLLSHTNHGPNVRITNRINYIHKNQKKTGTIAQKYLEGNFECVTNMYFQPVKILIINSKTSSINASVCFNSHVINSMTDLADSGSSCSSLPKYSIARRTTLNLFLIIRFLNLFLVSCNSPHVLNYLVLFIACPTITSFIPKAILTISA